MFPWDDARFFLAVQRTGSLSAAARQLGVNQSTVGRRLAALEESLGTRLFVRTAEGYVASAAGERLVAHAERMEEEAISLAREATGESSSLVGTVRVTAPDAFGAVFLVPVLAELHARHPQIELEIIAENRIFNLTKREADMAVRIARPREPHVVLRHAGDLANALYASKAYVSARGTPQADLAGHEVVAWDDAFSQIDEARWLAGRKGAKVALRTSSTIAQLRAAMSGIGLAVLPCYLADPEPELVRVIQPENLPRRQIWLAVHPDVRHAARIRAASDFIVEAIKARSAELLGKRPRRRA